MNYGPKSVTNGLILAYDSADNNSYVKTNLLTNFVAYSSPVYFEILDRYWLKMTNDYTGWTGYYPATVTSTGNHILTFTYYSDVNSSSFKVDNDGVMDNSFNATMSSTQTTPQTKTIRVNVTTTGLIQFYFARNSGGNIFIKDVSFFKEPTSILDASGSFLNGVFGPSGPSGPLYDADNSGTIYFDGTDDLISTVTSSTLNLGTSDYTVTGWYYFDSSTSSDNLYHNIFCIQDSVTSANWIELSKWRSGYANGLYYDYNKSNYAFYARVDNQSESAVAQWTHFACTRNGTTIQLFLNGVSKGTATITSTWSASSFLVVGRNNYYAYYMKGKIPVIRIYNRALSQTEILQNFNSTRKRFGV